MKTILLFVAFALSCSTTLAERPTFQLKYKPIPPKPKAAEPAPAPLTGPWRASFVESAVGASLVAPPFPEPEPEPPLIDWPQHAEPLDPRVANIRAGVEARLRARLERERVQAEQWAAADYRARTTTTLSSRAADELLYWMSQRDLIDYQISQQRLRPIRVQVVDPWGMPIYPGY